MHNPIYINVLLREMPVQLLNIYCNSATNMAQSDWGLSMLITSDFH